MKISAILGQKEAQVYSINPGNLVLEALKILDSKHIGALIVLDEEKKILGIISERDIIHMLANTEFPIETTHINEIMTPSAKVIVGDKNDDVEYVMNVMTNNRIRHLPIIDEKGKLIGIISIGDVIKVLQKDAEFEKKMLLDYILGKYPV